MQILRTEYIFLYLFNYYFVKSNKITLLKLKIKSKIFTNYYYYV